MRIRTYYWNDGIVSSKYLEARKIFNVRSACNFFNIGNAGDLMSKELLKHFYKLPIDNISNSGKRILTVGSIGHKILQDDLICGIGIKSKVLPKVENNESKIWGLRGPISYDVFKKAGFNVNDIKFLADPGLLLSKILPLNDKKIITGKVIFIPHYRERFLYKKSIKNYIEVVDIDCNPIELGNKILESEFVLTSSLHGIIFSHSLNRPCKFVLPQTDEPIIKFIDYFESVNLNDVKPLNNINEYNSFCRPDYPTGIENKIKSIVFPEIKFLNDYGIITV